MLKSTLPALTLLALFCLSQPAQAEPKEPYRINSPLETQTGLKLIIQPYAACTENQVKDLPAFSDGNANVKNEIGCKGKEGCTLTLHVPDAQEEPVQYYVLKDKVCTAMTADMTQAKPETIFTVLIDFPTNLVAKGARVPEKTERGTIVSVAKERVFTTVRIVYENKPTVDSIYLGENQVDLFY